MVRKSIFDIIIMVLMTTVFCGYCSGEDTPPKFQKVFCWDGGFDEEQAERFAAGGRTLQVCNGHDMINLEK